MTQTITEYQGQAIDGYDPDKVEAAAQAAAAAITADPTAALAVDFQPGNGSRYCMVLTPLNEAGRRMVGNDWLLSLPDHRVCYPISLAGHPVPSYVQEKWLPNLSDAVPVSQFLIALASHHREAAQ